MGKGTISTDAAAQPATACPAGTDPLLSLLRPPESAGREVLFRMWKGIVGGLKVLTGGRRKCGVGLLDPEEGVLVEPAERVWEDERP